MWPAAICFACLLHLTRAGYHYEDLTIGEFPKEIQAQLKELKQHYTISYKGCTRTRPYDPTYLLFTRDGGGPEVLQIGDVKNMDTGKKTIMIIHDWLSGSNSSSVSRLKDQYLRRYDCNVVIVDWSEVASKTYDSAYCITPRIGNSIGKFLCQSGLPLDKLHIVGHGLGAQIAGITSNFVSIKCKGKLGRITGLDPSGILFQGLIDSKRLDKSDANFVDIIHTDTMRFGYSGNIGTADYHVNCGQRQEGCESGSTEITDDTPAIQVFCSHHRSLEYMAESIMSDKFIAVSCGLCPRTCATSIFSETYTVMGEDAGGVREGSKFLVKTGSEPPFAQGWALYDAKLP